MELYISEFLRMYVSQSVNIEERFNVWPSRTFLASLYRILAVIIAR